MVFKIYRIGFVTRPITNLFMFIIFFLCTRTEYISVRTRMYEACCIHFTFSQRVRSYPIRISYLQEYSI